MERWVNLTQERFDKKSKVRDIYLTCFPANNESAIVKKMDLQDDKYPLSAKIFCNPEGNFVCSGIYAASGLESALGAYSIIYTPELRDISTKNTNSFNESFLTKGLDEKESEEIIKNISKNKDFNKKLVYHMDSPVLRKDGGYSLILENRKIDTKKTKSAMTGASDVRYYNFDDIIILTYNSKGEVRWMEKIAKKQSLKAADSMFGSYFAEIDSNDNIHIIYNDNTTKEMSDKAQPTVVTLNAEGEIKSNEIFKDNKDIRKTFAPQLTHKLSNDKHLFGRINLTSRTSHIQWTITD